MAKKLAVEVSLLPDQIKVATSLFDTTATATLKTRVDWLPIMDIIDSDDTGALKKELSALCKQRFLIAWRVNYGRDLTLEEIDRCKKSASSVFSEYTSNGGTRKTRAPKKTAAEIEAEKQVAIAEALKAAKHDEAGAVMGQIGAMAKPSTVRLVEDLRDTMNAVQADLMAFQVDLSKARTPAERQKLGESIGSISMMVADSVKAVGELLASLG